MSTGTSFSMTFAVTTGAAPPSPPRPRPLRPEEPPAADVLLPHPPSKKPDERHKQSSNARVNTMTLQAPDPCRGHVLQTAYSPHRPVIYAGERHLMSLYIILISRSGQVEQIYVARLKDRRSAGLLYVARLK